MQKGGKKGREENVITRGEIFVELLCKQELLVTVFRVSSNSFDALSKIKARVPPLDTGRDPCCIRSPDFCVFLSSNFRPRYVKLESFLQD